MDKLKRKTAALQKLKSMYTGERKPLEEIKNPIYTGRSNPKKEAALEKIREMNSRTTPEAPQTLAQRLNISQEPTNDEEQEEKKGSITDYVSGFIEEEKKGSITDYVSGFIGLLVIIIVGVSVVIPIVVSSINNSGVTGTTLTLLQLVPLLLAVVILVLVVSTISI